MATYIVHRNYHTVATRGAESAFSNLHGTGHVGHRQHEARSQLTRGTFIFYLRINLCIVNLISVAFIRVLRIGNYIVKSFILIKVSIKVFGFF